MKTFIFATIIIFAVIGGILLIDRTNNNSATSGLKVGEEAPDFQVQDYSGKTISKGDYKDKNILLYFNEGVGCPPCWQQAATLSADKEKFSALNVELLTIVIDPVEQIKTYMENYKITMPVMLDEDKKMSSDYQVLNMDSSMHMGARPGHTFVLVGTDNKIKWVGDYPEMNVSNEQIFEKVKIALGK